MKTIIKALIRMYEADPEVTLFMLLAVGVVSIFSALALIFI